MVPLQAPGEMALQVRPAGGRVQAEVAPRFLAAFRVTRALREARSLVDRAARRWVLAAQAAEGRARVDQAVQPRARVDQAVQPRAQVARLHPQAAAARWTPVRATVQPQRRTARPAAMLEALAAVTPGLDGLVRTPAGAREGQAVRSPAAQEATAAQTARPPI
jgi:hypothetical protein